MAPSFPAGVRVLPVVVIKRAASAVRLCDALVAGGIPCAEFTLRTPEALAAIEHVARRDGFVVGAGTVLNSVQARDAVSAGAQFLVSPGLDEGVWEIGTAARVPVIPGVATATEAQRAVNLGARTVKFFPAVAAGGIPALKALSAPFGGLTFMPTGGISLETAADWLDLPSVLAVGGTWMTPPNLVDEGAFDDVEDRVRATMELLDRRTREGRA